MLEYGNLVGLSPTLQAIAKCRCYKIEPSTKTKYRGWKYANKIT